MDQTGTSAYRAGVLDGLRSAIQACRQLDAQQQQDGLLREAIDCAEAIERLADAAGN